MSYPPPPGPPGGGWNGGDPNQPPPMQDPYGGQPMQDPYGGQPMQDPYGGQPPQDPYGQPPQDPYGQPPQDPYGGYPPQDPYGAPASGIPGTQPYSAPGYGQPVSAMPGPAAAPQQSNTGWIVGGVVGVVVIALAVVGTLFATGVFSSDDDDSTQNASEDSDSEDDDEDEDDEDDAPDTEPEEPDDEEPVRGDGGTYAFVEDLCDQIDLDPYLSTGLTTGEPTVIGDNYESLGTSSMYCSWQLDGSDSSEYGYATFKLQTFDDPGEAQTTYEAERESDVEWPTAWEASVIDDRTTTGPEMDVWVLDGNATTWAWVSVGDGVNYSDSVEDMIETTFEEIFDMGAA